MTTNFLGVTVEGDIRRGSRTHTDQKSGEEFLAALAKLFENELVEAVRWAQYTPYFNDGEPCEFSIGEHEYKITGVPDGEGEMEDGWITAPYTWTENADVAARVGARVYDSTARRYVTTEPGNPSLVLALEAFNAEFNAAYENVLLETFGDHAEVTATRDKFVVDSYDHE